MTRVEKNWLKKSMGRLSISSVGFMILGIFMTFGSFFVALNTTQTVYESVHITYLWIFALGLASVIVGVILSAKVAEGHKKMAIYKEEIRLKRDAQYFKKIQDLSKEGKILEAFKYFELMKVSVTQHMTLGYLLNDLNNKYKDSPENIKIIKLITTYLTK